MNEFLKGDNFYVATLLFTLKSLQNRKHSVLYPGSPVPSRCVVSNQINATYSLIMNCYFSFILIYMKNGLSAILKTISVCIKKITFCF